MSLPPNKNLLKEFPNPVYLETGIWRSDSIQQAIEAAFESIIGIDNDPACIDFAVKRFTNQQKTKHNIRLFLRDSATGLWDIIKDINKPMTIYLDAHYQLIEGTEKGENPFPLMKELEQISQHHIKIHTIIIDDLLYLTHPDITGWTKWDIVSALKNINPDYQFNLISNPVVNNMLVAWIP